MRYWIMSRVAFGLPHGLWMRLPERLRMWWAHEWVVRAVRRG